MKGIRRLVGALLVLVMLGSVVSPAMAKPTKTVTVPDRKNLSPRDLIDMKEISKYLENMSKEEIEKKYMEAVRKANEQYEKAVKEQDELVRMIVKSKKKLADNEINTVLEVDTITLIQPQTVELRIMVVGVSVTRTHT